jgi:Na+-driven multidrug efflux pump
MKLHKGIILSILALGVSPFIMASTESLVGFVLNSSLEKFGDIYVSALAIMQSAMLIVSVPLTGFVQGFVPIVSYNYGHHNRERVKECFKIVVIIMFSFNFLLISFMILFPSLVASAFTNDETLIETVRQVMPIFLGGMTIFGLQRVQRRAAVHVVADIHAVHERGSTAAPRHSNDRALFSHQDAVF